MQHKSKTRLAALAVVAACGWQQTANAATVSYFSDNDPKAAAGVTGGSASPDFSIIPPGVVDPGTGKIGLYADQSSGKVYIVGHDSHINSYELDSAAGKLTFVSQKSPGGYNTLTAQSGSTGLPGSALSQDEDVWAVISSQPGTFVAEAYPPNGTPAYDILGPGLQVFNLNNSGLAAWTPGTPLSDLTLKYGDGTGATFTVQLPEPTCLAFAGVTAWGLLSRRRRR
jgi:hypothetical protein